MEKDFLIQAPLIVKPSYIHGYGVFADQDFPKNEIIEECHFIANKEAHPEFEDYYFKIDNKPALLFGYGSLYNHSPRPNIQIYLDRKKNLVIVETLKPIKKGE